MHNFIIQYWDENGFVNCQIKFRIPIIILKVEKLLHTLEILMYTFNFLIQLFFL